MSTRTVRFVWTDSTIINSGVLSHYKPTWEDVTPPSIIYCWQLDDVKYQPVQTSVLPGPEQGSIDFNTANTTCSAGMYFLIHPLVWINDERMAVHCLESGYIGLHIPSDLEISLSPRDVPQASPLGHLSGLGKSLGRWGCATQSIPTRGSVRPFFHH